MIGLGFLLLLIYDLCLGLNVVPSSSNVYLIDDQSLRLVSPSVNVSTLISWYVTIAGVEYLAGSCSVELIPDSNTTNSNLACSYTLNYMDGSVHVSHDAGNLTSHLFLNRVTSNVTMVRCIPHTPLEDNRYWNITVVVAPSRPQCKWEIRNSFFTLNCTATLNPGGVCTFHDHSTAPGLGNYDVTYQHITYKTLGLTRTTCVFHGMISFLSTQHLQLAVSVAPNITAYSFLSSTSYLIDFYANTELTTRSYHVTHTTWHYSHGVTLTANGNSYTLKVCSGKEIIITCYSDGPRGERLVFYKTNLYHSLAVGSNPDVITHKISAATFSDGGTYGCVDKSNPLLENRLLVTVTSCDFSDHLSGRMNIMAIVLGVIGGCFILFLLIACCCRTRKHSSRASRVVSAPARRNQSRTEVNLTNIDTVDGLIYYRNRAMSDSPPPYSSVVNSNYEIVSTRQDAVAAFSHTDEDGPPPAYPGK